MLKKSLVAALLSGTVTLGVAGIAYASPSGESAHNHSSSTSKTKSSDSDSKDSKAKASDRH
jgi:hypothetical protein